MYAYLKGTVAEVSENSIVLDVGGIGYELNVSSYTSSLVSVGDSKKFDTYLVVKEDEMSLYAFIDKREKNVFLRLISISGIGPKLALSVLGGMKLDDLVGSIISGNSSAINGIKGVGKKTAERIVMELKDKLDDISVSYTPLRKPSAPASEKEEEAINILVALGFKQEQAIRAVTSAYREELTVNQIVHKAING